MGILNITKVLMSNRNPIKNSLNNSIKDKLLKF